MKAEKIPAESKKEEPGFYTVYTRQSEKVLEALKTDGVYRVREEYIRAKNDNISDFYLKAYRWFTEKCRERMTLPASECYPVWLSMHEEYRLRNTEGTVSLQLRIPKRDICVISEYAWGYRVNNMYVPLDPEDEKVFNAELSRYGIGNEAELVTGSLGNFYPLLKRKIESSFDRVFSLPPRGPFDELGVCFELRKEWVEAVETGAEEAAIVSLRTDEKPAELK